VFAVAVFQSPPARKVSFSCLPPKNRRLSRLSRPMSFARGDWRRWLQSPACRDPKSHLWRSWVASGDSGYPYEEATAWALGAGVEDAAALQALTAILRARPLARDGQTYLFDTAVALDAAVTLHAAGVAGAQAFKECAWRRAEPLLKDRRAVPNGPRPGEEREDTRWSESFGAHMLWLVRPLVRLGETEQAMALIEAVWPGCRADPLPKVHAAGATVYAHAAGYAAEGLAWGDALHRAAAAQITTKLLDVAAQHDGLIPAFVDHGPLRADISAQAWHLACTLGIQHTATRQIQRALQALTTPDGGIRYQPDSDHVNTCVTVFALRAEEFAGVATPSRTSAKRRHGRPPWRPTAVGSAEK
jgi:hypothetical protein